MKYSVFQFSQAKLVEFKLDISDALILSWFTDFFSVGMEKLSFKCSDGINREFGWIKLSKIIDDLPVLGINTEKGIEKRLDKLVQSGILARISIPTKHGRRSFYRATDKFLLLINTPPKETQTDNNVTPPKETQTDNNVTPPKETRTDNNVTPPKETRTDSNVTPPKETRTDNNVKETEKENSQGNSGRYGQSNSGRYGQGNSSRYGQSNSSRYGQSNSSRYALNDSSTSDSPIKDSSTSDKEAADAVREIYYRTFGKNAFDETFEEKAAAYLSKNHINNVSDYFEFIKKLVEHKQERSPAKVTNSNGLAYSLFFQCDVLRRFLDAENDRIQKDMSEKIIEQKKLICPVCGKHFLPDYLTACPQCGFDISQFEDENEINLQKKLRTLPVDRQNKYQQELMQIFNVDSLFEFAKLDENQKHQRKNDQLILKHQLDKKFGLI